MKRRSYYFNIASITALANLFCASPHARAQQEFKFPSFIAADCDSLMVVADPLPVLRRMLSSDNFRRFATTSQMAQMIKTANGIDPADILALIEANSAYVPNEIAIGFPSSSLSEFVDLGQLSLATWLCAGASRAGGDSLGVDLPRLQAAVLDAAKSVKTPALTIWVQFRNPQAAAGLFALASPLVQSLAQAGPIEASVEAEAIHIRASLGRALPSEVLVATLAQAGVGRSVDDTNLQPIAAALANLDAEIWLERFDDGLRFTLGSRPVRNAAYPVATLGPLWQNDASLVAFAKLEFANLKAHVAALEKFWLEWQDRPAGQAVRAMDSDDLIGRLSVVANQALRSSNSLTMQVKATDSLDVVIHEKGYRPVDSLTTSSLAKLLPREVEYIHVDARTSFGDHLADSLLRFEDRLGRQWLRVQASDRQAQVAMTKQASDFYYREMTPFRNAMLHESRRVFIPPVAILVSTLGKIERLDVGFNAESAENHVTVTDAPIAEYAAIGRAADTSRAAAFLNDAGRIFLRSFNETTPDNIMGRQDLGLGVETFAFQGKALQGMPHNITVSSVGDLIPHYFFVDGWLVVSSSPRVSKLILAAWRDQNQRFAFPQTGNELLAAFGGVSADTVARGVVDYVKLASDVTTGRGSATFTGPLSELAAQAKPLPIDGIAAMNEIVRLFEQVVWLTVDRKEMRVTQFRVMFPAPVPR